MSTYLYVVLVPLFLVLSIWALAEGIFGDAVLVLGVGTAILVLFGSLRVDVNEQSIQLFFGLGIIHRTIKRENIASVKQVRNSWWFGFGIRLTPHGWMWNASGLDAVEITYNNGKKFRIGTDDPEGLLQALN